MIQDRRDAVLYFLLEKDLLYLRRDKRTDISDGDER